MNQTLSGAVRSKTNYLGLLVTMMGYVQANLSSFKVILAPVMKPEYVEALIGMVGMAAGLAIIVVRFYTTESLAQKGAP